MFKSIQWKIIAIFLLLTLSVMIVVGTFLIQNISAYYYNEFSESLKEQVFTDDFVNELANSSEDSAPIERMLELLRVYSVRMGIDSFRNYYILDESLGVLGGSDETVKKFDATANLVMALSGKTGDFSDRKSEFMDYAVPIEFKSGEKYIIYVTDTKVEVNEILGNMFVNIFWALLFGILISAVLGFFLSNTIISPISTLQHRSEAMAEGDFKHKIEVRSRDEIGRLTIAFNNMAARINSSMEEIETEKNKVEAVLLSMTDAVCAFDNSGNLIHINPAGKKLLGECESETFGEIFERLGADVSLYRIIYGDQDKTLEKDIEYNGKNLKAFFNTFNAERSLSGGVVVVFQDITKSQMLDNARREFVANVSHELRTPLTTIKTYAETLLEMDESDEDSPNHHFIKVIENEADRMTGLVKDLLTLSKLDNSDGNIEKKVFDVVGLVKEVTEKLSLPASRSRHTLEFEKTISRALCLGEKGSLEQVITNIISNSIKYTPNGGDILVSCFGDETSVTVRVRDNGIGIPKEDLPHVFERFYRVDKARSRQRGGTGLGLAIAKEIVLRHGGRISIDSRYRQGTVVTVVLPLYKESFSDGINSL